MNRSDLLFVLEISVVERTVQWKYLESTVGKIKLARNSTKVLDRHGAQGPLDVFRRDAGLDIVPDYVWLDRIVQLVAVKEKDVR